MPGAVSGEYQSKNQRRRALKKAKKIEGASDAATSASEEAEVGKAERGDGGADETTSNAIADDGHDDELTSALDEDDPLYQEYKEIISRFQEAEIEAKAEAKPEIFFDDDAEIPDEGDEKRAGEGEGEGEGLSRKQRKAQGKLSIAQLKALVPKPDIVEWTDTSAAYPTLVVALKSWRNAVPVPSHWSLKREYLSSKRGIEKAAFALPRFIQDTGIAEMRDAVLEKQEQTSLKQKQRERVQPKLGKLDIDYQKLYEAFFRFQTKPELTRYGELYYEGKEFETNLKHLRPGELTDELKEALNIPPGAPPPWLINMQRFGPPPSYPALKIAGLNAPPPPGGQWGFHPGGYGKPPVDEFNRPLYGGDIFGVLQPQVQQQTGEPVEKTLWGELQAPEEDSDQSGDDDDDDDDDEDGDAEDGADAGADAGTAAGSDADGLQTPSGLETPGGLASAVPSEFAGGTDSIGGGEFTLRKHQPRRSGTDTEEPPARSAYTVLPDHTVRAQGFFGSDRAYDLTGLNQQQQQQQQKQQKQPAPAPPSNLPVLGQDGGDARKRRAGDVDVSVDVDALERDDRLSKDELRRQYDSKRQQEAQAANPWGSVDQDDLSQMIADESRKRLKKDEERRTRR